MGTLLETYETGALTIRSAGSTASMSLRASGCTTSGYSSACLARSLSIPSCECFVLLLQAADNTLQLLLDLPKVQEFQYHYHSLF